MLGLLLLGPVRRVRDPDVPPVLLWMNHLLRPRAIDNPQDVRDEAIETMGHVDQIIDHLTVKKVAMMMLFK
jgi:hypothetical protein